MQRKSLMRGNNARAYFKYLKTIGVPFEMICSNYTIEFKAPGLERKFIASEQSKRAFASFAKIKHDVKSKPIPEIDKEALVYFVHDFKNDCYVGDVINIDLKSAYATVLYRDGFISKNTFDYICACSKQERLVSVGMLASKKQHFKFDGGKMNYLEEINSETSNFFYHAVKRTGEIMDALKMICGNNYLFTWVDGLYLQPDMSVMELCENHIESLGFKSSTDWLREFQIKTYQKHVTVSFLKLKNGGWKKIQFNLPHIDNAFKRIVIEAILSRK